MHLPPNIAIGPAGISAALTDSDKCRSIVTTCEQAKTNASLRSFPGGLARAVGTVISDVLTGQFRHLVVEVASRYHPETTWLWEMT